MTHFINEYEPFVVRVLYRNEYLFTFILTFTFDFYNFTKNYTFNFNIF